eukprot:746142-Hanusia_phi.AAC.1
MHALTISDAEEIKGGGGTAAAADVKQWKGIVSVGEGEEKGRREGEIRDYSDHLVEHRELLPLPLLSEQGSP